LIRKSIILFFFSALLGVCAFSQQARLSLSSDFSLQHAFKKDQRYWGFGQTVSAQLNLSPKDAAYIGFCYYSKGKVSNEVEAIAKSSATLPAQIAYTNRGEIGFKQISVGWRHYLKGNYANEEWNLYGMLGFGLMFGSAKSTASTAIDTSLYDVPVLPGKGNFKRLTYDLGLGFEQPMGGDIFFYSEIKTFIPATDYPNKHLYVNDKAPLTAYLNLGFRILF
jgi:hypothetical protein